MKYDNTPTVVAVLATDPMGRLVAVLRGNDPGRGLLGLPGGYHMRGETWQEAGAREFQEETGLYVDPEALHLVSMETDEYGNNLVIAATRLPAAGVERPQRGEVMAVVRLTDLVAPKMWAFPRHANAAFKFFTLGLDGLVEA